MTIKTFAEISADLDEKIPTNRTRRVSPLHVREIIRDVAESSVGNFGVAGGIPGPLDVDGLIPAAQLPPVASLDFAVETDGSDWTDTKVPRADVAKSYIDARAAGSIPFTSAEGLISANVGAALDELDAAKASEAGFAAHLADTNNPHEVDATDVGLGNVDNTSDATKDAATATLTNKTIGAGSSLDADTVTVSNLEVDNFKAGVLSTATDGAAATNAKIWAMLALKTYIDNQVSAGFQPKTEVQVATTTAGTLATDFEEGDTVDGQVLVAGWRILLKDQAAPAENGIRIVQVSGAPTRATDMDAEAEVPGAFVSVRLGTTNAGTFWFTISEPTTLGTDAIVWQLQASSPSITAGDGLLKVGSEVSADLATTSDIASQTEGKVLDAALANVNDGLATLNGDGDLVQQLTQANIEAILAQVSEGAGTLLVATRTALKSVDTASVAAILTEGKRFGLFKWDATVLIATHQADTQEGVYVAPNASADGAWVRQFEKLSPFHFGALGNGSSDDYTALQAFFKYAGTNTVNADIAGAFRTSAPVLYGGASYGGTSTPVTKRFEGRFQLTGTAAMSEVFRITNLTFSSWDHLHITGTGSTNTWSSKTIEVGLYLDNANRNTFNYLHFERFSFAGIFAGGNNNSLNNYGDIRANDCGSGAQSGARMYGQKTTWANPTNSGSSGSVVQSTAIEVGTLPPGYIVSGTYGAVGDSPYMIRINGPDGQRLYWISSINSGASTITIQPWLDSDDTIDPTTTSTTEHSIAGSGQKTFTVDAGRYFGGEGDSRSHVYIYRTSDPTKWMRGKITSPDGYVGDQMTVSMIESSGAAGPFTDWTIVQEVDYVFGGGLYLKGNDSNIVRAGVDAIRCGIGIAATSLYAPQISRMVAQSCGVGLAIGRYPGGAVLGGEFSGLYFEGNEEDIIFASRATTVNYNKINSNYALDLSKSYVLGDPRVTDNSFSTTYMGWQGVSLFYQGNTYEYEKRPYSDVNTSFKMSRSKAIEINMADSVTFTPANLDVNLHQLTGVDRCIVLVKGTGGNGEPTGTITFEGPAGDWSVNGVSALSDTLDIDLPEIAGGALYGPVVVDVVGALIGDTTFASYSNNLNGLIVYNTECVTDDEIEVTFQNRSSSAVDLEPGTITAGTVPGVSFSGFSGPAEFLCRFDVADNDFQVFLLRGDNLPDFADDTAAASGGVAVNQRYRNGSVLMVRVS